MHYIYTLYTLCIYILYCLHLLNAAKGQIKKIA